MNYLLLSISKSAIFIACFITQSYGSTASESIVVEIDGIKNPEGDIVVAIFDKESEFLSEVYWSRIYPVNGKNSLEVNIVDIPPGVYAISIFHDRNANGQLDKNLIGVPKEPYGFSNNPKIKFRPPTFIEAKFTHNASPTRLEIKF